MNTAVTSIETLMAHPAPGIVFGPHERAKQPRRAHPSLHSWGAVMSELEHQELIGLTAGVPELDDLREVYRRSNGVGLFALKCSRCEDPHWALCLLPVSEWTEATASWQPGGDCASFMEECDLYNHGQWRVIASTADGSTQLVQFFSGQYRGEKLAGKIFSIGLGGILGFHEEVAPSLSALMDEITRDPTAFFDRIGFVWSVDLGDECFGDPIEHYTLDIGNHPDAMPWPPIRPV